MSITLRAATTADAEKLLEIYAPYVEQTAITFEYDVPSAADFAARIAHTLERYPYLVAEENGRLLGYAYTGALKARAAYDWCAETSLYVRLDSQKNGVGRMLYEAIERVSKAQNIRTLYACIGVPEQDDEHLTHNSAEFHAHLGYRTIGTFKNCGYKFGRWYHMIWMEKPLSPLPEAPKPVLPFRAVWAQLSNTN